MNNPNTKMNMSAYKKSYDLYPKCNPQVINTLNQWEKTRQIQEVKNYVKKENNSLNKSYNRSKK